MKLSEMFPKKASFSLKATGKKYYLRPITLKDQLWITEHYGDKLEQILNPATIDMEAISRIIFLLLVDKSDFAIQEFEDVSEEGEVVTVKIGGYKLLQRLIGSDEVVDVLWAFNENMGISRPVPKEEPEDKPKKKVMKKKATKKVKKKSKR